jgi:hypothetical protein
MSKSVEVLNLIKTKKTVAMMIWIETVMNYQLAVKTQMDMSLVTNNAK